MDPIFFITLAEMILHLMGHIESKTHFLLSRKYSKNSASHFVDDIE